MTMTNVMAENKKRILILGAGFGGLRTAMILDKFLRRYFLSEKYEVVLADRNEYHTYYPILYEVATAPMEIFQQNDLKGLAIYSVPELLSHTKVKFVRDEVFQVDILAREACLGSGILSFDYLILALGSETNFFGVPGAKENALTFKGYEDAIRLRSEILSFSRESESCRVVVGGAGATGVELAAEIKNWMPQNEVFLADASPTILNGFDERVVKKITRRLEKFGIQIKTGFKIKEVGSKTVFGESGEELSFDVLAWTGGARATSITKNTPFKKERSDRIIILEGMRCMPEDSNLKVFERVYAIGDLACVYEPKTGRPIPMLARIAIEQAEVVARNLISEIKKDEEIIKNIQTYSYRPKKEYPYVIPAGGKFAVAKIGGLVVSGFWGWVLKGLVEFGYLCSIMSPLRAIRIWLKGLWIFAKNDNLG